MTPQRGFTLIEVLMVAAIIALLSTVLMSSMRDARLKAADAAVRREAAELRTLMELERTNTGTYTNIKNGGGWKTANAPCPVANFSGQFAQRASEICTKLVAAASTGSPANVGSGSVDGCNGNCVYFTNVCVNPGCSNPPDRFTIEAYMPYASKVAGAARWLCIGSSGSQSLSDGNAWTEEGCKDNP